MFYLQFQNFKIVKFQWERTDNRMFKIFIWSRYTIRFCRESVEKDLSIFLDKIFHLNIGGWLRLEWEKLENWLYKRFVEFVKVNIQTCLGFVSLIASALTKLFDPVLVPNLMEHTTYPTHEINVICNLFSDKYTRFENLFQKQELEEHYRKWVDFHV